MNTIFISHSSEDEHEVRQFVEQLRRRLRTERFFVSSQPGHGIGTGKNWVNVLMERLRSCDVFVAMISPAWQASRWCFAEYTHALRDGKAIFPVLIKPGDIDPVLAGVAAARRLHGAGCRQHAHRRALRPAPPGETEILQQLCDAVGGFHSLALGQHARPLAIQRFADGLAPDSRARRTPLPSCPDGCTGSVAGSS